MREALIVGALIAAVMLAAAGTLLLWESWSALWRD